MPPGSRQGALGGIRALLPRLTWLDVLVYIVEPDLASFIHVGSDTEIRRRCHFIDTSILEREHEKSWSLGDSNPPDLLHVIQAPTVAGRGQVSPRMAITCGVCGSMWPDVARLLPTLAPNLAPSKLISSANEPMARTKADQQTAAPRHRGP